MKSKDLLAPYTSFLKADMVSILSQKGSLYMLLEVWCVWRMDPNPTLFLHPHINVHEPEHPALYLSTLTLKTRISMFTRNMYKNI